MRIEVTTLKVSTFHFKVSRSKRNSKDVKLLAISLLYLYDITYFWRCNTMLWDEYWFATSKLPNQFFYWGGILTFKDRKNVLILQNFCILSWEYPLKTDFFIHIIVKQASCHLHALHTSLCLYSVLEKLGGVYSMSQSYSQPCCINVMDNKNFPNAGLFSNHKDLSLWPHKQLGWQAKSSHLSYFHHFLQLLLIKLT